MPIRAEEIVSILTKEISQLEEMNAQLTQEIRTAQVDIRDFEDDLDLIVNKPHLTPKEKSSVYEKLEFLIANEHIQEEREKKIQQCRQAINLQKSEITQKQQQIEQLQSELSQKRKELDWQQNYAPHVERLSALDKSVDYVRQFVDTEPILNEFLEVQQAYFEAVAKIRRIPSDKNAIFYRFHPESFQFPNEKIILKKGMYKLIESGANHPSRSPYR